jgi:hypothetical protein
MGFEDIVPVLIAAIMRCCIRKRLSFAADGRSVEQHGLPGQKKIG